MDRGDIRIPQPDVVRWLSTERDPFARGEALGRALAPAIANTVDVYRRLFREEAGLADEEVAARGREATQIVASFRPHLAREIEGIAAGAGQPPALLFAVNARTELLGAGLVAAAAGGECSAIGIVEEGGRRAIVAQNWDFHPALAASRLVWTIADGERASFTGFTEAGMVGKLGVNDQGVAVCINFLATDRDTGLGGIPVHVLLRVLLEEARTLQEAETLIEETPMSSSVCVTVAGPNGDGTVGVVSLERWPGGVERHVTSGTPPHLVHTNHFVAPIAAGDLIGSGPEAPFSRSRYEQLVGVLADGARCDLEEVTRQLSSVTCPSGGQAVFRIVDETVPWLDRGATLATVAFEVPAGRFWMRGSFDADAPLELVGNARHAAGAA